MINIHIAICDDEVRQQNYLQSILSHWSQVHKHSIRISTFDSAESFLFAFEEDKTFDILLLDIQMKVMDGIELAKELRQTDQRTQIIFITGFSDFVTEGYEVSAVHYLMKPVKEDKLLSVLDKALTNLNQKEQSLLLTIDGEMHRIPFSEIRFIEAQGHYIIVQTTKGQYRIKMNLSDMQAMLDESFFRAQRSFIVNLKYVRRITRGAIVLDSMEEVPLSRNLYEKANQAIIEYFQ